MKYFIHQVFYFCLLVLFSKQQDENILCTEEYCAKYVATSKCPEIPLACKIQNATHNGLYLPYPEPCNCCDYCLRNLAEGEECVMGSPDSPPPTIICGDGLKCDKDKDTGLSVCVKNPTDCIKAQLKYDERKKDGTLGHLELRPQCDKYGFFSPVMCIPGEICFCVDKDGKRIFGELPYSTDAELNTKCACSRSIDTINKLLKEDSYSIKRARCLANGDYDSLQCINKRCMCVNEIDGSLADPKKAPVYISLTSELPCYDEKIHIYGGYWRSCEKEYNDILELIAGYKKDGFSGVIGYKFPKCQIDGKYAAIQQTDTHKYCASPDGDVLEDFILELGKEENDDLINSMNCRCARSRSILTGFEKPECCKNGNYKPLQCRRGKCRCVDINGMQVVKEVDYTKQKNLPCYTNIKSCTEFKVQ